MLIVLSPAKTLDETRRSYDAPLTQPRLLDASRTLISTLQTFDEEAIGALMGISPKLAALNVQRFRTFPKVLTEKNAKPAVYMFRGDVYDGLDIDSLPQKCMPDMQARLRILSGLYGVLRPMDIIYPYRLEMGTKLQINTRANLYKFWGSTLADALNEDAQAAKTDVLLNLASVEYASAIDRKALSLREVTVHFKEKKGNQLKVIGLFAKRARGRMARFVIEEGITRIEDLKDYTLDDYRFDSALSDANSLTFVRG